MRRIVLAAHLLLLPFSVLAVCSNEDFVNSVTGGVECIAIRTTAYPTLSTRPILMVWVHGSNLGVATIATNGAFEFQSSLYGSSVPDLVSVNLYRPGYNSATDGRASTGGPASANTSIALLPSNVDPVADAMSRLKAHYNARYLVTVSDSVGSRTTMIIAGRSPGVIDAAVFNQGMPDNPTTGGALCPCDYTALVPRTTKVWAVAAQLDTVAPPANVQSYISTLQSAGVTASVAVVAGRGHPGYDPYPGNLTSPAATELIDAVGAAILSAPAGSQTVAAPTFSATTFNTPINNLTMNVTIPISVRDVWRTGNIYLGASYRGAWYLRNSTGWVPWIGGALPTYATGPLNNRTFAAFLNTDVSAFRGAQVYAGYGLNDADMIANGKFGLVYTVP